MTTLFHSSQVLLGAFQVSDYAATDTHNVIRVRTEVVIPRSRSCPHLVVLQPVRIDEHAQLGAVTEWRNTADCLGNLLISEAHHVGDVRIFDRLKTDGFPEPWRHSGRRGMTCHG